QSVAPPGGTGSGGTGGGGPDIIVVQEAENKRTLRDLSEAAGGYQWVIASPDEESALRCGVLSRYPPVSTKAHRVRPSDGAPSSVPRHVLEVELDVDGRRLLIIAVHLKSKLGGAEETEPERAATAAFVSAIIADKVVDDPNLAVIVAGDFNENPDEYERVDHAYTTAMMPAEEGAGPWLCVTGSRDAPAGPVLFCPWEESTGYSYLYQGTPERIDNILVSQALVHDGACPFRLEAFSAEPPEFAVTSTGAPIRWDQNTSTGYSDHLPIQALLVFTP
ncbi:MAG: endonuclease/exonuclease/phosphatase family protein, partial [Spirochaetales bacterium]|nr:endonuclease/exonuclease/phosphatase family protein [Spirochaetales bacterium]